MYLHDNILQCVRKAGKSVQTDDRVYRGLNSLQNRISLIVKNGFQKWKCSGSKSGYSMKKKSLRHFKLSLLGEIDHFSLLYKQHVIQAGPQERLRLKV